MHQMKEAASPHLMSVLVRRTVRMEEVLIFGYWCIFLCFLSFSKGFNLWKGFLILDLI